MDRTAGTSQSLLSSLCSLLTDNRCLGFSGNMHLFAGLLQPLKQNKNLFPCLQTCNISQLLVKWKEISCWVRSPAHTDELIHAWAQSSMSKTPPSPFLFTLTQKQISYTAWLPPLICLMKSIWRLPLLTNLQARLVHLGLNTVMGTSCLVNKQARKHKMHCSLCIVLFTGLSEPEIMRIRVQQPKITFVHCTLVAQVFISEMF